MVWKVNKDEALEYKTPEGLLIGAVFRGCISFNGQTKNGCIGIVYGSYPNVWKYSGFFDTARDAKAFVESLVS